MISAPAMIEFTHAIYAIISLRSSGTKQYNTAGTMVKQINGKDINRKKRNLLNPEKYTGMGETDITDFIYNNHMEQFMNQKCTNKKNISY